MKKSILSRWLFGAMMLFTAASLVACVDDNEDEGMPYLETDVESLAFSVEGGEATFTVRTNRPWTLTQTSGSEWITLDPVSGEGTTTVEVVLPGSSYSREGSFSINLSNAYGVYMTKTIDVKQGDVVPEEVIYYETCGTESVSSPYPYPDSYTAWVTEGTGIADVSYSGNNTSIRASGLANEGSGPNVIFFGTAPAYFQVNKIALTESQTRLQLSFLGSFSATLTDGSYNNTFDTSLFKVQASADGETWVDLPYTKNDGDSTYPYWIEATSDFVLTASTDYLYLRFTASYSSAFRIDDIKLSTLNGTGTSIDLSQGSGEGGDTPDPTPTDALWHENFGTQGSAKSAVADYTDWEKGGSLGSALTYAAASGNVSVRESGKQSAGYADASGSAFCFFGTNSPAFSVSGLALASDQSNLTLNFGGRYSKMNSDGSYDNTFKPDRFHVYLSKDGSAWTEITYTTVQADEYWVYATADFTLAAVPANLWIKFAADDASVFAIDDCNLAVGSGGQSVDLSAGGGDTPDPEPDSSFPGAGEYMMVWTIDGKTLAAIPATTYYIFMQEVSVSNNSIAASGNENCNWTIAASASTANAYTIKDSNSMYYAMSSTYNSFNLSSSLDNSSYSYDWTFAQQADGTFQIMNVDKQKWFQYTAYTNSSTGAVTNEVVASTGTGELPKLYKLNASGTAYELVGSSTGDTGGDDNGGDTGDDDNGGETGGTVAAGTILWTDDFSQFDEVDADGTSDISTKLTGSITDFTDAYSAGAKVYQAPGSIKLGTSSVKGSVTTPAMSRLGSATADATLTVDLQAWLSTSGSPDGASVVITVNNGGTIDGGASVTATLDGTSKTYSYTLSGLTSASTVTFEAAAASKCRFYLDNLKIVTK